MKLQEKKDIVKQLTESVASAQAIVFTDFQGLKAEKVRELRRTLRASGATFQVVKNTLLNRSLKDSKVLKGTEELALEGPTGVILTEAKEPALPLKALLGFIKDNNLPTLKSGLFEGVLLSVEKLKVLAGLSTRKVLLGQFAGSLLTPLRRLAFSLQDPRRKLVYALSEIAKTKGGEH